MSVSDSCVVGLESCNRHVALAFVEAFGLDWFCWQDPEEEHTPYYGECAGKVKHIAPGRLASVELAPSKVDER